MRFERIADGFDVAAAAAQIDAQPALWNAHSQRTTAPGSPHAGIPDIWLRFRPLAELTAPERFLEPHVAAFYPAWRSLTALHGMVWRLVEIVRPVQLGGILITRIPPGGRVDWHHDRGSWHAEFHNRKIYLPLRANDRCVNWCADERAVLRAGEATSFDNLVPHMVENRGATERITAIICMREER